MDSQRFSDSSEDEAGNNSKESSEEEWTECSSESFNSDSESTIPDWEPYIDDLTGELLYIECHPFVTQNNKERTQEVQEPFSKNQLRRSTRGKFLRLIRRRESKRKSKKNQKFLDVNETTTSKVKFQDFQEGEEKEVILDLDVENRHNLSSEKSLAESLLGLIVSALSDGNRVMIAGFSYDSKAKHERNIKIGDWLKSINNVEVNIQNLDDVLQKFINKDSVLLKLQRVAGIDVTKDPPINELNNESNFVKELLNIKVDKDQLFLLNLCKQPVGIVFINTENLKESNQENEDIIYCFPKPAQKNLLSLSRGMYLTLNHLLYDITKTKPRVSTINSKGRLINIMYSTFDKNIFMFMLPDDQASFQEIHLINNQLLRMLEFSYGSIEKCFIPQNHNQLDHFFSRFFVRYLNGGQWITVQQFIEDQSCFEINSSQCKNFKFDELILAVPVLVLPDDAQVQIDDALTELEASDYREWNEEPLDCQRLFTILGSALFHSGYLLVSHLIHEDLADVYCFCEQLGLFHLSKTEPIKSLLMWKEIFPSSCKITQALIPDGKRYLLVVGSGKDLLTVIMEAGGCTEPPEDNLEPDAFYVEEVQATLAHIQELGLSEFAERYIVANQETQVTVPQPMFNKRKNDFINLGFSKINSNFNKEIANAPKKNEVTSILKRSADQTYLMQYSSNNSLQEDSYDGQSEESGSQGGYSEMSDESNKKTLRKQRYDSEEDSDTDECGGGSQISGSSFDVSEIRQSLLSETEEFKPVQFTSGNENSLYYFIHLDFQQSILLCPIENKISSPTYKFIINNFKRCSQKMHVLFENTLRFKNMPAQDISKSLLNKSLIAIKEHGITFECPYFDEKDIRKNKVSYRVIGRLFYVPYPKEIYICFQQDVPQNIVEMAFKMDMATIC